MRVALTLLAIAAAIALLAWLSLGGEGVDCEVCVQAGGGHHCTTVRAGTPEEALEAAHRGACGVAGNSMTDELACQRRVPLSQRCN